MKVQRSFGEDTENNVDSPYGMPRHDTDEPDDERTFYGTPRHEVGEGGEERRLYGEPQHERVDPEDILDPDVEFASVWLGEFVRPTGPSPRSRSGFERATTERR